MQLQSPAQGLSLDFIDSSPPPALPPDVYKQNKFISWGLLPGNWSIGNIPLNPASDWKLPHVNLIIMHYEWQHTLVITITVHQSMIHPNSRVGGVHSMTQMQPINTGIWFDQRLLLLFYLFIYLFISQRKEEKKTQQNLHCTSSSSAGMDLHNSTQAGEVLLIYTGHVQLTERRGDTNSPCCQSRKLLTSRMVKGELGIKPTEKTATNFRAVYVHA